MTTEAPAQKPRSSRSVGDMIRSLAVVGAIVAVLVVANYLTPPDPVKQIDPYPMAIQVSTVAGFPVLMPSDANWRATTARWEPTAESAPQDVWFTGGVYSDQGPFASVSQSTADSQQYISEQTADGKPTGASTTIDGVVWQRYESQGNRSLVLLAPQASTIVTGTGSWQDVERFAASLREVSTGSE